MISQYNLDRIRESYRQWFLTRDEPDKALWFVMLELAHAQMTGRWDEPMTQERADALMRRLFPPIEETV